MARCLVWRFLLLPAACLLLGLGGCAGTNPAAEDSTNPKGKPGTVAESRGKNSSADSVISKNAIFPSEVEGLQLISLSSGEETCSLMHDCLGAGCKLKEAYIAGYRGEKIELVFWIVEMEDEPSAVVLLDKMNDRIKTSPSFTGYQHLEDGRLGSIYYARFKEGHPVFNHNYLYNRCNWVYWVNISDEIPLTMLKRILAQI